MHHIVAIIAFLFCYFTGVAIALSGPGDHDLFGWAMLLGVALAVPSLCFVGLSYLLFSFVRWWVTIFLSLGAAGIFFRASGVHSEGWNVALAVVIATVVHQLTLLLLQGDATSIGRSIK
jgi:hypothetical protein